jgi:hypothetical protein
MTKIKQMAEKDEKKLVSDFKKLSLDAQEAILKFTAQVADTAQKDNAAKLQAAVAVKTASEAAKTKKAEGSKKK